MSEELKGQMERRTLQQGTVPAPPSTRSSSVKETVTRSKQWRGPKSGQVGGQYPNQGNRGNRGNNERRNPQQQHLRTMQGYHNIGNRNYDVGDFDLSDFKRSGSKAKYRKNLDCLLNFQYARRERTCEQQARYNSKRLNRFNKERFLQANCQFVVSDSADYTAYAYEPDILVDWSLVEQVRIFSHEVSSCPICLFPPTAAKITRCGHVYCWSCILHYLTLGEKCPICFVFIEKKDLKSVVAIESHCFTVGQTITMRLMKKEKITTLVLPKSQWKERELIPFNINDSVYTRYSKLLLASPKDVLQQVIEREETALSVQYMEANVEQSSEICFIECAKLELKARKCDLIEKIKTSVAQVERSLKKTSLNCSDVQDSNNRKREENLGWNVYRPDTNRIQDIGEYKAAFSDETIDSKEIDHGNDNQNIKNSDIRDAGDAYNCDGDICKEESQKAVQEPSSPSSQEEGCELSSPETRCANMTGSTKQYAPQEQQHYYFYQAEDGQNIFLHPMNYRCLIKEYGDLEKCPEYITAKIIELEAKSQTEESRKRYSFLRHLPLTCEFVMCELELGPPVISTETFECFKGEIQGRKKRRQRKLKVEKRRESKVDAKMAFIEDGPSQHMAAPLNLSSEVDFPTQSLPTLNMDFSPVAHRPGPFAQLAARESYLNEAEGFVDEGIVTQEPSGFSPPSFAQALRTGKTAEATKPVRKHVQHHAKGGGLQSEDSDEDYVPPSYQSTFYDGLSLAISRGLEEHKMKDASQVSPSRASTGKRQKKPKKTLLFSTAGHHI